MSDLERIATDLERHVAELMATIKAAPDGARYWTIDPVHAGQAIADIARTAAWARGLAEAHRIYAPKETSAS